MLKETVGTSSATAGLLEKQTNFFTKYLHKEQMRDRVGGGVVLDM